MLYQEYKQKMHKVADTLLKIWRFRLLIIGVLILIFVSIVSLLAARGNFTAQTECPSNIIYGESLSFRAEAFMSNVSYEYALDGSDNWSSEFPHRAGNYKVRAVSDKIFGAKNYSESYSFTIDRKAVTITLKQNGTIYGDAPLLSGNLAYDDLAVCSTYVLENELALQSLVTLESSGITIYSSDNQDVTDSYIITTSSGTVNFSKRPITVTTLGSEWVYDAQAHNMTTGYEVTSEKKLVSGHSLSVLSSPEIVNVGTTKNSMEFKVLVGDVDVSSNYNITVNSGDLKVTKRPVSISTVAGTWVYDGTNHFDENFTVSSSTPLISGHTASVLNHSEIKLVGSTDNNLVIKISDGSTDVSTNYEISYDYATLQITPRPISVKPLGGTHEYDGTAYSVDQYQVTSGSFVAGDDATVTDNASITNVGQVSNTLSLSVLNNSSNISDCYTITYETGDSLVVTARPITFKANGGNKVYDGIPLSNETSSVTAGSLAVGQTASFESLVEITNVGTITNNVSVSIFASSENVSSNYNISYAEGDSLTVTQRPILVTADDGSKIYDGYPITVDSFEVSSELSFALVSGHRVAATTSGSRTDVGTTPNTFSGTASVLDSNNNNVSSNYAISTLDGLLEVYKRVITFTAGSDRKTYDGTALTSTDYEITSGTLADNQNASVSTNGSQIDAGTSTNNIVTAIIRDALNNVVTENYEISYLSGSLIVDRRPVTILTDSNTKVYDGQALYDEGYNITSELGFVSGETVSVVEHTTIINAEEIENTLALRVSATNRAGISNYDITQEKGTLKITKRHVDIVTANGQWIYNGEVHKNMTYTVASNSPYDFVAGQNVSVLEGSGVQYVNQGNVSNYLTLSVLAGGNDVASTNYEIAQTTGTLFVTVRNVTVESATNTFVYNGAEQYDEGYTVTSLLDFVSGENVSVTSNTKITYVSESGKENRLSFAVYSSSNNVSSNYSITVEAGTLSVTKREITATACSLEKIYDGTPLLASGVDLSCDLGNALGQGDIDEPTVAGSQTNKGFSASSVSDLKIYKNNVDVTANYNITPENGVLTVTARKITVTAEDVEKVYDGVTLTSGDYTISSGTIAQNQREVVVLSGSIKYAGTGDILVESVKIFDAQNSEVQSNYEITTQKGQLLINQRPITIVTADGEWTYDGNSHASESYEVASTSLYDFVTGDTFNDNTYTEVVNANSYDNDILSYTVTNADGNITSSYDISINKGTLLINQREVKVTTESDTWVYDGQSHQKLIYSFDTGYENSIVSGETISVTDGASVQFVNDGTVINELEFSVKKANNDDSTINYNIIQNKGELLVTVRTVEVTTNSNTWIYSATEHSELRYSVDATSPYQFVVGERVGVTHNAYITSVGTLSNELVLGVFASNDDVLSDNYLIEYTYGELEITKRHISVQVDNASKIYDGTALTSKSVTLTCLEVGETEAIVGGHTYYAVTSGSQTNVGTSDNEITSFNIMSGTTPMNDNYDVAYSTTVANLTVNQRPIEITADSDSKLYDGEALTCHSYTITSGSLVEGDIIEILDTWYNGSQTEVGESANEITQTEIYVGEILEENKITANYDISFVAGVLKVLERRITITSNTNEKTYDGTALTDNGFTYTIRDENGIEQEDDILEVSITVNGTITNYGTVNNTVDETSLSIMLNGEDVTSNYVLNVVLGTLKINKLNVAVTTATEEFDYDGEAHHNSTYEVTSLVGFIVGDVAVTHYTEITDYNNSATPNKLTLSITDGLDDISANYKITYTYGNLSIKQREISFSTADGSFIYNGEEQYATEHSITSGSLVLGHTSQVLYYPTITYVSESVKNELTIGIFDGTVEKTNNYIITFSTIGALEVTQRNITISAQSDSKTYDATPLVPTEVVLSYSLIGEALGTGDSYVYTPATTKTITNYGTFDFIVEDGEIVINKEGVDVSENYLFTYDDTNATLTINKREITIIVEDASKEYDGTPLTSELIKDESELDFALVSGHYIVCIVVGEQTIPGNSLNVIDTESVVIYDANDTDVTDNYDFTTEDGLLTVTPREIILTTQSFEKFYDGTPLTNGEAEAYLRRNDGKTALVSGHTSEFNFTGTQTNAGTSKNKATVTIYENTVDVSSYYIVTNDFGDLLVKKLPVAITTATDTFEYDGNFHYNTTFTCVPEDAFPTDAIVTAYGSYTQVKNVSEVENEFILVVSYLNNDITGNYEYTYTYGKLTVTPREISVTPDGKEFVYNGLAQSFASAQLTIGTLVENQTISYIGSTSITYVSDTLKNTVVATIKDNFTDDDVSANYNITYLDGGNLTVTQREITIKATSSSKVYDGTPLVPTQLTLTRIVNLVSETALGSGDQYRYTPNSAKSITNVSEPFEFVVEDGEVVILKGEIDVTANYLIIYSSEVATLTITKLETVIKAVDKQKEYDSTALTSDEVVIEEGYSLVSGHYVLATPVGSQTIPGSSANVLNLSEIKIFDENDVDVTENYDISKVDGLLTVTPRKVNISTVDLEKVYDGEALTNGENVATLSRDDLANALVSGHTANYQFTGTQLDAGESDNTVTITILDELVNDVTSYYDITEIYGKLTVNKRVVVVNTGVLQEVYDGLAHNNLNYTINENSDYDFVAGETVTVIQGTSITNVGTALNELVFEIKLGEVTKTDNYEISQIKGTLEITPLEITITPNGIERVYNGEAQNYASAEITDGVLAENQSIQYVGTAYVTFVTDGEIPNTVEATILDADSENVTSNYEITYAIGGNISITEREISVYAKSQSKVYDGTILVPSELVMSIVGGANALGTDDTYVYTPNESKFIKNFGTLNFIVEADEVVIMKGDVDVSANYLITYRTDEATLEITKRIIRITANSAEKEYDDTPLTDSTYTTTSNYENAIAVGDEIIMTEDAMTSSITYPSETANTINPLFVSIQVADTLEDVTANYEITFVDGLLKVTKRLIKVSTENITKVYDGTPLVGSGVITLSRTDGLDALVSGHTYVSTFSGTRTEKGESDNGLSAFSILDGENDVSEYYDIEYVFGKITITPRLITINTQSDEFVYDGEEHFALDFEVDENSEYQLVEGHEIYVDTYTKQTNAGVYDNVLSFKIYDADGRVITDNYTVTPVYGTLTINKRAITYTTNDSEFIYNGEAQSYFGYSIISGSFVDGQTISYTDITEVTYAGETAENSFTFTIFDGITDITDNYEFTCEDKGTLTVQKRKITATAKASHKVYDGTPLVPTEATLTCMIDGVSQTALGIGDSYTLTSTHSITNVGYLTFALNNNSTLTIIKGQVDVSDNYEITYSTTSANLTITARPITVTAASDSKEFDNTPLTSNNYDITSELSFAVVDSQVVVVVTNGTITYPGTTANTIASIKIYLADNVTDVTSNYAITSLEGTLTVTARNLIVTTISDTKVYDNTPLTNGEGLAVLSRADNSELLLAAGHTASYEFTASQTNVGSTKNTVVVTIMNGLEDVTSYYSFTYVLGDLTVTKRNITISTESGEWTYDGNAHSNIEGLTVIGGELCLGHEISVTSATTTITYFGSKANAVACDIVDGAVSVGGNYYITYQNGTLTINPREVTVAVNDASFVYDGAEHSSEEYTVTSELGFVAGDIVSDTANISLTYVDSVENKLVLSVKNTLGDDISSSYIITYSSYGTLSITQREITVSAKNLTKIYDNTALTVDEATLTCLVGSALGIGDTYRVTSTATITEVGFVEYTLTTGSITIFKGETDVTENYIITYTENTATLTITERPITVTSDSNRKEYDGTALLDEGFTVTIGTLIEGHTLTLTTTGTQTDAGNSSNTIDESTIVILDENENDVTLSYDISTTLGTLTVTKRAITFTTTSDSKTYDGTPLTNGGYELSHASGTALVLEHEAVVAITGTQTNAGSSSNSGTITIELSGVDVTSNYDITTAFGSLTVNKLAITVQTQSNDINSADWIYDGTPHSYTTGIIITSQNTLVDGHILSFGEYATITNATSISNEIIAIIVDADDNDFTANYDITYDYGTLTISKRSVSIETDGGNFVYDGIAKSVNSYTVTSELGFVTGETVTAVAKNEYLLVDSYQNELSITIENASGEDTTNNYEITHETYGTINITERAITVSASNEEKVYDGTPLTGTAILSRLVEGLPQTALGNGDEVTSTTNGSQTIVGSSDNTVTSITIMRNSVDVTYCYDITYAEVEGTLTVNARTIVVTAQSDSKQYDGLPLTNAEYFVVGDGITTYDLALGHTVRATTSGSQLYVGTSANQIVGTVRIFEGENEVTSNYSITTSDGILEVTERVVELETKSAEWVYDGQPHSFPYYDIISSSMLMGHTLTVFTDTSITDVGSIDNTLTFKVTDAANVDITAYYNITITQFGTLKINERPITIQTESYQGTYDAITHYNENFTVTTDGFALLQGHMVVVDSHAEIINAGTVANTLVFSIVDVLNENNDVTTNYSITQLSGTLKLAKREISVATKDKTWVYDGLEHSFTSEYTVTYPLGAIASHTTQASQNNVATITFVGTVSNRFEVQVLDENEMDVTSNYSISYPTYGTLEVTVRKISVTALDAEKVYDGTPLKPTEANIECTNILGATTGLAENDSIIIYPDSTITVVQQKTYTILDIAVMREGEEITYCYEISYPTDADKSALLTITPRPITITVTDKEKQFDNTPLTSSDFVVSSELDFALVSGHKARITTSGTITDIGIANNIVTSYGIYLGNTPVSENYEITVENGTLTITARQITVTIDSAEKVYDGSALTSNGYLITSGSLIDDDSLSMAVSGSQIVVGSSANSLSTFTITQPDGAITGVYSENGYICGRYLVEVVEGTLTVNACPITVKTGSYEGVYDANSHQNTDDLTITSGSLIGTDYIICDTNEIVASRTNVGTTDNTLTVIILDENDFEVTDNYAITYEYGTIHILPITIEYQTASDEKTYDGTPLTASGYEITNTALFTLPSGHNVTITPIGSVTTPSTVLNNATYQVLDENLIDVTENYNFVETAGSLTITPLGTLIVSTGSAEKEYDNIPLTESSAVYTGALVSGHTITLTTTGTITIPGVEDNTVTVLIEDEFGKNVTEGYAITEKLGKLTVYEIDEDLPTSFTIKPVDVSKVYDGTPLVATNTIVEDENLTLILEKGYYYTVAVSGSRTDYGTTNSEITEFIIYNKFGADVTSRFVITEQTGTIKITHTVVKIMLYPDEYDYDGTEHGFLGASEYQSYSVTENPDNVTVVFDYELWLTNAQTLTVDDIKEILIANNGMPKLYNAQNELVTDEYEIEFVGGPIVIKPITLTVRSRTTSKSYDGTPLVSNVANVSGLVAGDTCTVVVTGTITDIGSTPNTIESVSVYNSKGENVSSNYTILTYAGTLTIR